MTATMCMCMCPSLQVADGSLAQAVASVVHIFSLLHSATDPSPEDWHSGIWAVQMFCWGSVGRYPSSLRPPLTMACVLRVSLPHNCLARQCSVLCIRDQDQGAAQIVPSRTGVRVVRALSLTLTT